MHWCISANGRIYDHEASFGDHGSIDWKQGSTRYTVWDTVFVYSTRPVMAIEFWCEITEVGKTKETIRDDKQYWKKLDKYEEALNGKFFNLKLLRKSDSPLLRLDELRKLGFTSPQGPAKIQSEELLDYIVAAFEIEDESFFPDSITPEPGLFEGAKKQVSVNRYERDPKARLKCIQYYGGYSCIICKFDFLKTYGDIGKDFIHVHHIVPLKTIGETYEVQPEKDLVPVCPNCHAMLHRKHNGTYLSVDELKDILGGK